MNPELATQLNALVDPDTGLLPMFRVAAVLEQYANANVLDAYYTGGTTRQDEVREAYATALAWNSEIIARRSLGQTRRGIHPFIIALAWVIAPLLVAVAGIL